MFDLMSELPESDQQRIHANVAGFKVLLDENAETRPPPELVEKLGDLRSGLMALAPAVADSAGGWMAEG